LKRRIAFVSGGDSRSFVVRAGSSVEGRASGSRKVYRESQTDASVSVASVKQIATSVAPFGVVLALTLGIQFIAKFFYFFFFVFYNTSFAIL
jgi:hypothetical protein